MDAKIYTILQPQTEGQLAQLGRVTKLGYIGIDSSNVDVILKEGKRDVIQWMWRFYWYTIKTDKIRKIIKSNKTWALKRCGFTTSNIVIKIQRPKPRELAYIIGKGQVETGTIYENYPKKGRNLHQRYRNSGIIRTLTVVYIWPLPWQRYWLPTGGSVPMHQENPPIVQRRSQNRKC